ncbi:MAG TPA: hypothetical protein VN704_10725 [Verrucomicrobiae bacterium]|nr:hypothetical protein [Verrucomicrobiae bacterium]
MSQSAVILNGNTIKNVIHAYNQDLTALNDKSKNYLKNNNEKDFSEITQILKKMYYDQIVFPKKIRNEKNFKHIKNAFLDIDKIDKKLRAHNMINQEISKDKTNNINQESIKNFETFLKVIKQSQMTKSNKIIIELHHIKIPPPFNDKFIHSLVSKKTKKIVQTVYKLTKAIEKQINIIASNNINDESILLKKIIKLQKNLEKLQFILNISLNNDKQNSEISTSYNKNKIDIVKKLEKAKQILYDISNSSNALKLLKKGDPENQITHSAKKIHEELRSKQIQFTEMCKQAIDVKNTQPSVI